MDFSDIGGIFVILSFILMPAGAILVALSYFLYKVPDGHALIKKRAKDGRLIGGQWTIFLTQPGHLVPLTKETLSFPTKTQHVELLTPDEGILGIKVSVTYSPDSNSGSALNTYAVALTDLPKLLEARTQSALNSWVKSKPLPGTLKRAVTMKDEAENFVRAKLTSISSADGLIIHNDPMLYYHGGYPVSDLGVCIHEVHITEMQALKRGTGKADWGDGDEMAFNAEKVFNQFKGQAGNLSNLRKLKEALIEKYQDEAEDIEDIYDQVRLSMKEGQ